MDMLFALVFFIACMLAVASFFTPKTAFFLKNKTKAKAFWLWLGIAIVSVTVGGTLYPVKNETTPQASTAKPQVQILPFTVLKKDETIRAAIKRNRLNVAIAPTGDYSGATQEMLAVTVMEAAKKFQQESKLPVVAVQLVSHATNNPYAQKQLALATYIPDGKGFGGTQDSQMYGQTWEVSAAKRGFTAQELEFLRLWGDMRSVYVKNDMLDEKRLREAVEKRMNVAAESINPFFNIPEKMSVQ